MGASTPSRISACEPCADKAIAIRESARAGHSCWGFPAPGKSAYSKALGAETGRPTLIMDVGALMGSLVGSTEANIRQALRMVEAAKNVVPVAMTAAESVQRLRNWASGRCLNADAPGGIYTANPDSGTAAKPGRKVRRDPSNNRFRLIPLRGQRWLGAGPAPQFGPRKREGRYKARHASSRSADCPRLRVSSRAASKRALSRDSVPASGR